MATPHLPVTNNGDTIQLATATANAIVVDKTLTSAYNVTLQSTTNWVRIFAKLEGIYVKSGTGATAADWDWYVPANQFIDLVIPSGTTQLSFLEESAGAKLIYAEYT